MNSLEDLNDWVNEIKKLEVNDNNIDIFINFIRFSPEKIASRLGIEQESLTKEFNKHKKEVHNKIIIHNRVNNLKKRKLETSIFNYNGISYQTKLCFCLKFLKIKSNVKFYPSIIYTYCEVNGFICEQLILFSEKQKIYITESEFNEYFIDMREFKINSIISH